LLLLENMKPIKIKSNKAFKLYRMMDMDITEQQLRKARDWYESANKTIKQAKHNNA